MNDKEKNAIRDEIENSLCSCGHKKNSHSRFIDGLFVGCQECKCDTFEIKDS